MAKKRICPRCKKSNRFPDSAMDYGVHCVRCGNLIRQDDAAVERASELHGYLLHNKVAVFLGLLAIVVGAVFYLMPRPVLSDATSPAVDSVESTGPGTGESPLHPTSEMADEAESVMWKPPAYEATPVWLTSEDARTFSGPSEQLVAVSGEPAKYVAIGTVIQEVATGRVLSKRGVANAVRTAISGDGEYFAVLRKTEREQQIVIHPTSDPAVDPKSLGELPLSANVGVFRFAGQQLIVQEQKLIDSRLFVYNVNDGSLVATFETGSFEERSFAFSPDHQRIAFAGVLGINVYELASGRRELLISPPDTGHPLTSCNGLAFSPDGRLLAALLHENTFVVLDLDKFTRELTYRLANRITHVGGSHRGVQWLPNGSGWMLNGSYLLLADPMIEAWKVPGGDSTECHVVDSNNLLVVDNDEQQTGLKPLQIPWKTIDERLQTAGDFLVKPGGEITLALNLSDINPRLADQLTDAIESRCIALGLTVRTGARLRLLLDVEDKDGTTRNMDEDRLITKSGILAEMNEFACNFRLQDSVTRRIVWRYEFRTDGGLEVLDARTRSPEERTLRAVFTRISFLNLPSLILEDPKFAFPITESPKP